MNTHETYRSECPVYPGLYTPNHQAEEWMEKLDPGSKPAIDNTLTIEEYNDHFVVQIPAPGLVRENILVLAHDEVITVAWQQPVLSNTDKFKRIISLPGHIDTDFIIATYRNGLLHLYIPKSVEQCHTSYHQVAVY